MDGFGRKATRLSALVMALGSILAFEPGVGSLVASAQTTAGALSFSNTPLLQPAGDNEPEISIGSTGTMGIVGLQALFRLMPVGTHLWTGPFGSTPTFQGLVDADLQEPGKVILGSEDADVDLGSTGTMHITTLISLENPITNAAQLGVTAITCPNAASASFTTSVCTRQIIGTTNTDRPWVTSDGSHVYIAYHDPNQASITDVKRSDDDGYTWQRVGDPVVGQGVVTADTTFNSLAGNVAADPVTHDVFDIYASGVTGLLKGTTFTPNHIFVSRSTDMGQKWTANLVYQAPAGTSLAHFFPTLAVDPTNGNLYAAWSDGQNVSFAMSSDQGAHWSPAVTVNTTPANTAVFPWLAAYNGTVDLGYYATDTSNDASAVWNVYLAQTTNGGATFTQSPVSNHPNHVGVVCTNGDACPPGTRALLDLFKVAIDPLNGEAAIIYTDTTLSTAVAAHPNVWCPAAGMTCPLPQVVLAQQQ
jgi:hypothetical protein